MRVSYPVELKVADRNFTYHYKSQIYHAESGHAWAHSLINTPIKNINSNGSPICQNNFHQIQRIWVKQRGHRHHHCRKYDSTYRKNCFEVPLLQEPNKWQDWTYPFEDRLKSSKVRRLYKGLGTSEICRYLQASVRMVKCEQKDTFQRGRVKNPA